jgi:hypothetical protein
MILLGSHTVPKEYDIGLTSLEHNKGFLFGTL